MAEDNQTRKTGILDRLATAFERESARAVDAAPTTDNAGASGDRKALLDQAVAGFNANKMGYHLLTDREELLDSLANNIYSRKASRVALAGDELLTTLEIAEGLAPRLPRVELLAAEELTVEQLAECDIAVTGADAILAETGTLVCSGLGQAHLLPSLLPRTHFCVAAADRIFADLRQWASGATRDPERNYLFISGPSRTADIEKKVVIGVHGPWRLSAFLIRNMGDEHGS